MCQEKKCAFCLEETPDKKNTHFVTDAIIRTCLNYDGSNKRERGTPTTITAQESKKKYEREASGEMIREHGENLSDEEIESLNLKRSNYSVDYIFCNKCEKLFTIIENDFLEIYNKINSQTIVYNEQESSIIRLFIYLTVWRISICDSKRDIKLPEKTEESLRVLLYSILSENYNKDSLNEKLGELDTQPLNIKFSYIPTPNGDNDTRNFISFHKENNLYIYIINRLYIQICLNTNAFPKANLFNIDNEHISNSANSLKLNIVSNEIKEKLLNEFIDYFIAERYKLVKEYVNNKKLSGCLSLIVLSKIIDTNSDKLNNKNIDINDIYKYIDTLISDKENKKLSTNYDALIIAGNTVEKYQKSLEK